MKYLLEYEDLPEAIGHIDRLVYEANKTRKSSERVNKLKEANRIADEYNKHCLEGGNTIKNQFHIPAK